MSPVTRIWRNGVTFREGGGGFNFTVLWRPHWFVYIFLFGHRLYRNF